ncbi:uncharacterized protein PpBr36_09179 [Pyricularia pennisetigena]|uniref:uncharacterized protein n=1 Tax=Pyricularia pennisetigena TaxID=1578925 RepID=UPI00114D517C|nr:uncharacterized protein PpBr36_09179 [Pyricularia pennisetigena]TLS22029.1 hypothetical protein PpBr36_09179 [Pyricularia pennisetigena]
MQLKAVFVQTLLIGAGLCQVQIVQKALQDITQGLTQLDNSIKALSDAQSGATVLQQASALLDTMKSAATSVKSSQELTLQDALGLQQAAQQLPAQAKTTIDDLVSKKSVLDQLGATQQAIQSLKDQKVASDEFGKIVVTKIPAIGQQIAQQQLDQISQTFDQGITGLGGTPGKRAVALVV